MMEWLEAQSVWLRLSFSPSHPLGDVSLEPGVRHQKMCMVNDLARHNTVACEDA